MRPHAERGRKKVAIAARRSGRYHGRASHAGWRAVPVPHLPNPFVMRKMLAATRRAGLRLLAVISLAGACGSPTDSATQAGGGGPVGGPGLGTPAAPGPGRAATAEHAAGNFQQGRVGELLPRSVAVRVVDAAGGPVRDVAVRWTALAGSAATAAARTDASGVAETRWTLGTAAGRQTLRATVDSLPAVEFTAVAGAGPPTTLAVLPEAVVFGVVDDTAHLAISARDAYGNVVADVSPTLTTSNGAAVRTDALAGRHYLQAVDAGQAEITVAAAGVQRVVAARVLAFASVGAGVGGRARCGTERGTDAVFCWGENGFATLGDGTQIDRSRPVPSAGGALRSVTGGELHMCGLAADGRATCWGYDAYGQVGAGALPFAVRYVRPAPLAVAGAVTFTALSAGKTHTCGVAADGAGYCWGANYTGQLGRDTVGACGDVATGRCASAPLRVSDTLRFRAISAGPWEHSCGVTPAGEAYCWGSDGGSGRLGLGGPPPDLCGVPTPYSCSRTPRLVAGGVRFASVVAGGLHSCGLDAGGQAYCWGIGGSLGDGTTHNRAVPGPVAGDARFTALVAGYETTCGLSAAGELLCWGRGVAPLPAPRHPTRRFVALSSGDGAPCGILASGALVCDRPAF